MTELVRLAARSLPPDFDIDVLDIHRRGKRDAPSGTALALGAAAGEGRRKGRNEAPGPHGPEREIAFASVRAGEMVGEHSVLFSGPGEQLSVTHRASDRSVYAWGALAAALWLASRPAGRYSMGDVLEFKQ